MHTYKIYTLGCKVAQAEAGQLRLLLDRFGMSEASKGDSPDLCVVNTCAVTVAAAGKSRRLIAKLARLYPAGQIALLGCYASIVDDSVRKIPQLVLIADHRRGITCALEQFLLQVFSGKSVLPYGIGNSQGDTTYDVYIKPDFASQVKNKFETSAAADPSSRQLRHRAFLKVQDGCNANCTYCIIPHLRPKIHSVPENDIVIAANRLIQAGHNELVLCGIFLGAYGKNTTRKTRFNQPGEPLADLIEKLLQIPNLGRLRLSSLEPLDLTDRLIQVLASSNKVAGHLHLPLQSGSDNVLRRMARQYRAKDFLNAVDAARKAIPDLALTTDIIVGFPGETEEDFQQTLQVSEKAEFMKIHTFPFSPRPGTVAYDWKNEIVDRSILQDRLERLKKHESALARRFRDRFLNRTVRVLVEEVAHQNRTNFCLGRADQYFTVRFPGPPSLDNQFRMVKIVDSAREPLTGREVPG